MKTTTRKLLAGPRRPLFARLFLLLTLVLQIETAHAAIYHFANSGNANDDNDGSTAFPKRSLQEASDLALPGNTLRFKRGDVWSEPTKPLNLIGKGSLTNPAQIVIEPWGTGNDPVISTLDPLNNAGWTRVPGTYRWQHTVTGYSDARRLFASGASLLKVTTSENDVNETWEWYIKSTGSGTGIVYMYTGSATVGPQNVEVLPVTAVVVLQMKYTHNVTVRYIDFRGGSAYHVVSVEAPSSNIDFDHNTVRRANFNGILVANLGTAVGDFVDDITVSNCTVDKVWSDRENVFLPGGDGIAFLHAVENSVIFNNVVQNWGHVGIEVAGYRGNCRGVHNIVVEQNRVTAGARRYMHAFSVYGFEGGATDVVVRRNFFYDFTSTCHAMGNGNKFYSNIFARVRRTTIPGHTVQPYGIDMDPWVAVKVLATDPTVYMVARDNFVANNTFYDIDGYPILVDRQSGDPSVTGNIFYNNLIVNYGYPHPTSTDVGFNVTNTVTGPTYARNNNFWDGGAGSAAGTVAVARYLNPGAPNYTAAQLNTPGIGLGYCTGNRQLDPKLQNPTPGNNFALGWDADAYLKTGGLVPNSSLRPPAEEWVDYFGQPWRIGDNTPGNPGPSIGAIQASP